MSQLFIGGRFRGFLDSGAPNVGGLLYSYASGTTEQKTLFADASLSTPCTYVPDGHDGQAIVLNSRGECQAWLGTGVYTIKHCLPSGTVIDTTDGVQAPTAGGGTGGPAFIYNDVPTGTINGTNKVFLLASPPNPSGSLNFMLNGLRINEGVDFALSGRTITYGNAPQVGDSHIAASYTI